MLGKQQARHVVTMQRSGISFLFMCTHFGDFNNRVGKTAGHVTQDRPVVHSSLPVFTWVTLRTEQARQLSMSEKTGIPFLSIRSINTRRARHRSPRSLQSVIKWLNQSLHNQSIKTSLCNHHLHNQSINPSLCNQSIYLKSAYQSLCNPSISEIMFSILVQWLNL